MPENTTHLNAHARIELTTPIRRETETDPTPEES
jgi:hypothetical protein